jgi:hypothetical protein
MKKAKRIKGFQRLFDLHLHLPKIESTNLFTRVWSQPPRVKKTSVFSRSTPAFFVVPGKTWSKGANVGANPLRYLQKVLHTTQSQKKMAVAPKGIANNAIPIG